MKRLNNKNVKELQVGDIVCPAAGLAGWLSGGECPIGVITTVMGTSVSNPYSTKWSDGGEGTGFERKDLCFILRPPPMFSSEDLKLISSCIVFALMRGDMLEEEKVKLREIVRRIR